MRPTIPLLLNRLSGQSQEDTSTRPSESLKDLDLKNSTSLPLLGGFLS